MHNYIAGSNFIKVKFLKMPIKVGSNLSSLTNSMIHRGSTERSVLSVQGIFHYFIMINIFSLSKRTKKSFSKT